MARTLYDDTHVAICRMLDRRHNNPLEDRPWPLLARLVRRRRPRVLDVGCGRGASSLHWARRGAQVVGLDPSAAMIAEARRALAAEVAGLDVAFHPTGLDAWRPDGRFDLVLLHDVLCYVPDRASVLGGALALLRRGGILSLTDYHGVAGRPRVDAVTSAWAIRPPLPFDAHERALAATGARLLLAADTTGRYRDHWAGLLARLEARREAVAAQVGVAAVDAFAAQIHAILAAVDDGEFGHLWAVMEAAT